MKKLTSIFVIVVMLVSIFSVVGCGGEQITLNKTEITLKAYTTEQLVASEEDLTWSSSDETIAVVSDGGLVTALKVGTATIKAEKEGKSGTCIVTVEENENAPILEVGEKEISLIETETYILDAKLIKGEEVLPATITYSSSNTEIAEVTGFGVINAKLIGQCTITVSASAEGYTISEEIALTVREDIDVLCDIEGLELVIVAPDSRFITQKELNVEVYNKDVKIENAYSSLSITSNAPSVAVYEESTKLIKAVGVGEAIITVSYTSPRNSVTTVEIPVFVDKAHINDGERLTLDASKSGDMMAVDFASLGLGLNYDTIQNICIVNDGKKEEINYGTDGFGGVTFAKSDFSSGSNLYYVQTQNYVYVIDICVADQVINDADGLIDFLQGIKDETPSKFILLDKYIALGADIDLSGRTLPGIGWENEFAGTFDGRGYTISNAKFGIGLFNYVRGTVKNLSIIDAQASYPNGRNGFICAIAEDGSLIENIYIKGVKYLYDQESDAQNGGVIFGGSGTVRNVVAYIEYVQSNMQSSADVTGVEHGALARALSDRATTENVFVVSQTAQRFVSSGTGSMTNSALFASESDMIAGADFTAFDGMWRRDESGIPVLKGYYDFVVNAPDATAVSGEIYFNRNAGASAKLDIASLGITESEITKIVKVTPSSLSQVAFTRNNGIYVAKDALARGENTLYVYAGTNVYEITVVSADRIITSDTELVAFFTEIANTSVGDNYVNVMSGEYIILANSIILDQNDLLPAMKWNQAFAGTFDGRGHTISNANVTNSGGLFRTVIGAVKNLKLTSVKSRYGTSSTEAGEQSGIVAKDLINGGIIENVYAEASKYVSWTGYIGGLVDYVEGGVIRNCVVKISYYYAEGSNEYSTSDVYGAVGIARLVGLLPSTVENNFAILTMNGTPTLCQPSDVQNTTAWQNNYAYKTDSDLIAGNHDYSAFTGFWSVEQGQIPTMKGANE